MFKRLYRPKQILNALISLISDYWELPYYGPCAFFFGEPDYPEELQ